MKLIKDIYNMNLNDKNSDDYNEYFNLQSGRSGIGMNHNQILWDLTKIIPAEGVPEVKLNFELADDDFILDAGCRDGKPINDFHKLGYRNTYGFDIGDKAEKLWDKNIEKEIRDFLFKWDAHDKIDRFGDTKFKLITSSHLIEHCFDPKKVLNNLYELLSDDGLLHTQFPFQNYEEWKVRDHKPHYSYWEDQKDWRDFLSDNGFTVIWEFKEWRVPHEEESRTFAVKTKNLESMTL